MEHAFCPSCPVEVNGHSVRLTPQEKELFLFLTSDGGSVKTRNDIKQKLYPSIKKENLKIIDVLICKIRKKLQRADASQSLETVRGVGYRWNQPIAVAHSSS